MSIRTVAILTFLVTALTATAEMVIVDARLSTPSEGDLAQRHLAIVEGAAMEPFFDSGHIVIDSPADEASALGALLVLRVVLELQIVDNYLVPTSISYDLQGVEDHETYAAGVIEDDPESNESVDQRLIRLGTAAADEALATWMRM